MGIEPTMDLELVKNKRFKAEKDGFHELQIWIY